MAIVDLFNGPEMKKKGIWQTRQLKNEKIGMLFGLSYPGVTHSVK
jgi:hypothetical protein